MPLRTFLKDTKRELKPIPDEMLRDLFLDTMNRINDSYISGTTKFIEENYPGIDDEINKADGKINEIWKNFNKGESSIEDFKEALASYEKHYLQAIRLYKQNAEKTINN